MAISDHRFAVLITNFGCPPNYGMKRGGGILCDALTTISQWWSGQRTLHQCYAHCSSYNASGDGSLVFILKSHHHHHYPVSSAKGNCQTVADICHGAEFSLQMVFNRGSVIYMLLFPFGSSRRCEYFECDDVQLFSAFFLGISMLGGVPLKISKPKNEQWLFFSAYQYDVHLCFQIK